MENKLLRILLVEDNPADVLLTRMTLEETGLPHQLLTVADGESALNYLENANPLPDLVMLDLNLPLLDGFEVLERIRTLPHCDRLPVIILSSSPLERDRGRALELGAQRYFEKPNTLSGYKQLADSIQLFWQQLSSSSGAAGY